MCLKCQDNDLDLKLYIYYEQCRITDKENVKTLMTYEAPIRSRLKIRTKQR